MPEAGDEVAVQVYEEAVPAELWQLQALLQLERQGVP